MSTQSAPKTCPDCLHLARCSAEENWEQAQGRVATADADYAEIASWAAYYVESGDSEPCYRCQD